MKHEQENMSTAKLGLIAGKGCLPLKVIEKCLVEHRAIYVIFIRDNYEPELYRDLQIDSDVVSLGAVGECVKLLKQHEVEEVVMVGGVKRPSFSSILPDAMGISLVSRITKNKIFGDNNTLKIVVEFFRENGFTVVGVDKVLERILAPLGLINNIQPCWKDEYGNLQTDIDIGVEVLATIGKYDIGQAVIVQQGQIIAIEGIEGSDQLIQRSKDLLYLEGRAGIFVKIKKANQINDADLPTIGVTTVLNVAKSGLQGIVVEAEKTIIVNLTDTIRKADELGIFILGIDVQGYLSNMT